MKVVKPLLSLCQLCWCSSCSLIHIVWPKTAFTELCLESIYIAQTSSYGISIPEVKLYVIAAVEDGICKPSYLRSLGKSSASFV